MRVAVLGANGQLGTDLCASLASAGHDVLALGHDHLEISDRDSTERALDDSTPNAIVNTVAFHDLERCEERPDVALSVNASGARHVADWAERNGSKLVHVSTNYVFDGRNRLPYEETDLPKPLNTYGVTKLAGEHWVRATCTKSFVARTSGLYGLSPCRGKGRNFVETMLHLASTRDEVRVDDDEEISPTFAQDLADAIVRLLPTDRYGLYHLTSEGSCTWHRFAREILDVAGSRAKLSIADPSESPKKTPRPSYSVLSGRKLRESGFRSIPDWRDGLRRYLELRSRGELGVSVERAGVAWKGDHDPTGFLCANSHTR